MTNVQRQFLYIESGRETLFGWAHKTEKCVGSSLAAVICNPFGVEYMSGHRSIRRLADRLAICGIPALRFDYTCTGDSTGGDFRNITVNQIVEDIRSTSSTARSVTGASHIVLIGIGLGATFAALAADGDDSGQLVLWNPTTSGRRFVREQRLLSEILDQDQTNGTNAIDSAGLFLSAELQQQISSIDLTKLAWIRKNPLLLISRSDMDSHGRLVECLSGKGFAFEHTSLPGYAEMMNQPTETVVPVAAIEFICGWLEGTKQTLIATDHEQPLATAARQNDNALISADDISAVALDETPAHFGENGHLFGIACRPHTSENDSGAKRAFVFLNCGSEHHSGPHRMYTILCRRIASYGEFCFRFDIEGIGDSISVGNNDENNAYSPVAISDIDQALSYLAQEYGCSEFIVSGICAGAYHSFKAATMLSHHNIKEANLINPLVFEWNYDDPEDHFRYEVHTYKSAIRDKQSWRRLISGDINYRRLFTSVLNHTGEKLRSLLSAFGRVITRSAPQGLPNDLRTLRELHRPLTLILSERDPGLNIMKLQAWRETQLGLRDGRISVHHLPKSNHGLSKKAMQNRLMTTFIDKYFADRD